MFYEVPVIRLRMVCAWLTGIYALTIVFTAPALAGGDAEAAKGKMAYRQLCAQCHGPNMVNPGTSSFDLRKFPKDQFDRFSESVTNGKGDMPAWGDMLVPGELESLWAYVQTGGAE
jgi:mono/diheme cytochrome c family protein